ncbi:MAG: hypothetical protein QW328_05665 [Nitrososphaerota archaeon]
MHKKHGKRRGISAIVGGIIILAIFFATIIPLVLLMQNSYTIFLQESNSRRIFDIDRASELLAVEISQDKATKDLLLILSNDGPVYIKPVRVWAIDVTKQTSLTGNAPCLGTALEGIPPGESTTLNVQQCVSGFTGIVQFIVVSERGRLFTSNRVILAGGQLVDIMFPYTLTISILNMKRGSTYEVRVEILGEGNITPSTFTYKATASNENVTVAFGATAGRYKVSLYEDNKLAKIRDNPVTITVPDTTAVIFDLGRVSYEPVPLDVDLLSSVKRINIPKGEEETFVVQVWVQLPRAAMEPVRVWANVEKITLTTTGDVVMSCYPLGDVILDPNMRSIIATCDVTAKAPKPGGYTITITAQKEAAEGEGYFSGLRYINLDPATITISVR